MPLQAIEPRRLYRKIADQLRRLMDAGEYAVGSRLPPERDLATQLGVSRPSVREALIALEVEGRVEVRMGSGIYVLPRPAPAVMAASAPLSADGPFDVIRARYLIEGELAASAARTMNAGQHAGLRHALRVMVEESRRGVVPIRGDRLFHLRIAEAADNPVLLRLVGELFDERHNPLFAKFGAHFENDGNWQRAIVEHTELVDAIAARDPDAARAAMHRHLQSSLDRFTVNWNAALSQAAPSSASPPGPVNEPADIVHTEPEAP